jgi:pyruvate formate lyase activating enzyme
MGRTGLNRRDFIRAGAGAALSALPLGCGRAAADTAVSDHEALQYEKLDGRRVRCTLCPRECIVPDGGRGYCEVRQNQGGVYKTLVYGRVCAAHVDPIEKKPLFHFLPAARAFSVATAGCNVECQFCQNWDISQRRPEDVRSEELGPRRTVEAARRHGCPVIAFTYSEPTVFYEYVLDTAHEARGAGLHPVSITNGFIRAEPMKRLCEVLSAVKIDLKAFSEEFYREHVYGQLRPVLDTIVLLKEQGMHTELVTLLIPGLNDGEDEVREMSRWVVENLGPDVPMHFSRFHPAYKMTNLNRTPASTVVRARQIAAAEGVRYAYTGNLPGHEYENTFCHHCGERVVERYGYVVGEVSIEDGKCAHCGAAIPGVWH